jgi:hypothetical protein
MSVKTVPSRTHGPNGRVISWQWRPTHPNPALVAAVLCGKSPLILTLSVRSEAASGKDRKPLSLTSAANAADSSFMRLFTLAYSSAYAWFGPFRILPIIRGFMGMTHERAKGNPCPVSSRGVDNPRRSAAPHRVILCASIHWVSQTGTIIDGPDNSCLFSSHHRNASVRLQRM